MTKQQPKLIVKKVIHAKREDVFDAWTKPELMQKWFFPGSWSAITTNELKVGGKYSHDMISDGSDSPCATEKLPESNVHYGEYLEIKKPEKLVFTWNSWLIKDSKVTIELRDLGNSTELTLTHELLGTEEICQKHNQGWEGCLANLEGFFK